MVIKFEAAPLMQQSAHVTDRCNALLECRASIRTWLSPTKYEQV